MFKARSPLTHLTTVQTTYQSKISAPIPMWSVRSPTKKYRSPIRLWLLLASTRLLFRNRMSSTASMSCGECSVERGLTPIDANEVLKRYGNIGVSMMID
jgi:hypothetical protein